MRTETEIREKMERVRREEFLRLGTSQLDQASVTYGWLRALKWVLKEAENAE